MLLMILLLWVFGGTLLYISSLPDDTDEADNISAACNEHNIPVFFGRLTSYIITVVIGLPFFIITFLKSWIVGGINHGSRNDQQDEPQDRIGNS